MKETALSGRTVNKFQSKIHLSKKIQQQLACGIFK